MSLEDDGLDGGAPAIVFVADATAEAESLARALRSHGYTVVDVPLSMLVARVAVQHPRIVLVDADSHGALEVVARMRELPQADDVHVIFLAATGGALTTLQEALAHEGSALFVRPVDVAGLTREMESLTGGVRRTRPAPSSELTPVPSMPRIVPNRPSSSPSLPPASIRAASFAVEATSFSEPAIRSPQGAMRAGFAMAPPVSAELAQLLAEAERRVVLPVDEEPQPSPEQELEAVLPAELLAALDEPLAEEEEPDAGTSAGSTTAHRGGRDRTTDGGFFRTTDASTGGGATPKALVAARSWTPAEPTLPPDANAPSVGPGALTPSYAASEVASEAAATTGPPPAPPRDEPTWSAALASHDAPRIVGNAVAQRTSGSVCIISGPIVRRIVFREGDFVTCASTADDESLLAFLGARGDLPRETVRRLDSKFPPFGRHAGAALVARGYLLQDQLWPTLRAHAEWLVGRVLRSEVARVVVEAQAPGRLASEPSVFGGTAGAAVFVDVVRRVVAPADALEQLGGSGARIGRGSAPDLMAECGLATALTTAVRDAPGMTLEDVLEGARATDPDFASAIFALAKLGVLEILQSAGPFAAPGHAGTAQAAALDVEAVRERICARLQLVEDGDYFAVLGVPRQATGYEVRRAFLELRRAFEPTRLLTPGLEDLLEDVRKIATVLEEAYEVLKDGARRERYRRAIEVEPG